jgi:hypothetical protein
VNGNSIFTPMDNNCFPSPENLQNNNRNLLIFQNFYDSPKKNMLNGHINNYHRLSLENYNNFGLNIRKENENLPTPKKNSISVSNNNKNDINTLNNNNTKKFFTDYGGYGYKCSCSKTNCNRYYCECYRSGLYCIDCNCKNCQNKPPKNCSSNRNTASIPNKQKTELVTCTCTKSGCNKKYCECYKNGTKCNSSCRCVACENSENGKKIKDVLYKCCLANSIYIIKNKIIEEDIGEENSINDKNSKILMKKRKRTISVQN